MILDTSAIVAAIANEPDAIRFQNAMLEATALVVSAITVLECRIVLQSRHGAAAVGAFDEMLGRTGIAIAPFDAEMAQLGV
jgi:ribonuclease VapC